jgi:predicted small secreted protein
LDESILLSCIGIFLGVVGIGVTIVVTDRVHKLQQKEQSSTENIINRINEIIQNQARIIGSMDERRERHINWFVHH